MPYHEIVNAVYNNSCLSNSHYEVSAILLTACNMLFCVCWIMTFSNRQSISLKHKVLNVHRTDI